MSRQAVTVLTDDLSYVCDKLADLIDAYDDDDPRIATELAILARLRATLKAAAS